MRVIKCVCVRVSRVFLSENAYTFSFGLQIFTREICNNDMEIINILV